MINENKKGVRAVKRTVKTKNPVAKAHQTVGSGSGEHTDKKRSADQVRGQKHKNKELAEFAALAPIAGAVGRAVVGGVARTAANAFADDEPTENSEYDDEAGMADNNLETMERALDGIDQLIRPGDNLPEWCQEKIAVAKSMLVSVWDYMKSEESRGTNPNREDMSEAEYQGRKVALGKPMQGDVKKSKVYVRKPNGKIVKVNFGDKTMRIKKSNPDRRKSFRARHHCENPGPRWKARYWSCRAW